MSDVATTPRTRPGTSVKGFSAPAVLLMGVVIIPTALGIAFGNVSAPDDEAYVRMAFATVAGATVAIVAVLGLLIDRIVRRATISTIALFSFLALIVVPWQLSAIAAASELVLARLGT
ncbi:hypothetical protein [Microbacterium sulfonylureivorans]|uniref:hypothetical protein n=1 Tax=Microbacterium sulfonylureivorans TaxID=2486854 RepID=UPI000FDAC6DC|nr:hypothetical protein [Microbacterium sulfonylureivorans]